MSEKFKSLSDKELVVFVAEGNVTAFNELIIRHHNKVFALAMRLTKNQEDAEEVLQDVFITLFRKAYTFKGNSAFTSWLYRITSNAAFMLLRKNKRHRHISIEDISAGSGEVPLSARNDSLPLSFPERAELREAVVAAINSLPEHYRAVFVLRDVDKLSSAQVSEQLQLSIAAVKSRLHRSRQLVRQELLVQWQEAKGETRIPERRLAS